MPRTTSLQDTETVQRVTVYRVTRDEPVEVLYAELAHGDVTAVVVDNRHHAEVASLVEGVGSVRDHKYVSVREGDRYLDALVEEYRYMSYWFTTTSVTQTVTNR